eukprot:m.127367 g.127367  ORF g.127367 m.127367 type:complete len:65 (-) comp22225_c0_seq1:1728-1922(-)
MTFATIQTPVHGIVTHCMDHRVDLTDERRGWIVHAPMLWWTIAEMFRNANRIQCTYTLCTSMRS